VSNASSASSSCRFVSFWGSGWLLVLVLVLMFLLEGVFCDQCFLCACAWDGGEGKPLQKERR
jgi:hypothetical protein